jgi:hypothetical protein
MCNGFALQVDAGGIERSRQMRDERRIPADRARLGAVGGGIAGPFLRDRARTGSRRIRGVEPRYQAPYPLRRRRRRGAVRTARDERVDAFVSFPFEGRRQYFSDLLAAGIRCGR